MNRTQIEWVQNPDGTQGYTWNPIPHWDGYFACKEGLIASVKRGKFRIMSSIKAKDGHLYIFLYNNGVMVKQWVHRLILMTFSRQPSDNEEGRHLNGDPGDNSIKNLKWGTKAENQSDRIRHGTSNRGERSGSAKLTEVQVLEIRQRVGKETLRSLAKEYGVSHTAIRRAAIGMKWSYL